MTKSKIFTNYCKLLFALMAAIFIDIIIVLIYKINSFKEVGVLSGSDIESFDTPGGGKIVFFPNNEGFIEFFRDNSQTRPIRDILVFHPFHDNNQYSDDNRYVFLHKTWKELAYLGEGLIHCDNTAMIEFGHGLDSVSKMIACIEAHKDHFERDIILLMSPPMFATDSILIKTSDELIYIGPNDGSLGFIPHELIVEIRRLAEPSLSYRVFAAAKIVAGWDWDIFSVKIDKEKLVAIKSRPGIRIKRKRWSIYGWY